MPTISLCMITKNAGQNLSGCLDSVKGLVNEILITDTGSTDNTKEIAKKFHAKISDFIWNDSFANARNHSIKDAQGDWILFIDDDERLSPSDHKKIQALLTNELADAYQLIQRNYTRDASRAGFIPADHYPEAKQFPGYFPIPMVRLFRNRKGYSFRYRIHEGIEWSIQEKKGRIFPTTIPLHHFNFTTDAYKQKAPFYITLGELQLKDTPKDPKPYFELGQVYRSLGEWQKAKGYFEKASALNPQFPFIFFELGLCAFQLDLTTQAIAAYSKDISLSQNPASMLNLANLYYREGEVEKSIELFAQLIEKNPHHILAYKNLSKILFATEQKQKAVNVVRLGLVKNPQNRDLIKQLKRIKI